MNEAKYIKGAVNVSQMPSDLPVILLLGRSNVGKSSLINALTKRKALARTSGTPGKTIVLNYYLINDSFYIVDAPGYGYARRSKDQKTDFIIMIENILLNHPNILKILLLVDFKIGPTADDLDIYEFLGQLELPKVVVATKKDKVPVTRRFKREREIREKLNPGEHLISVSNTLEKDIDILRQDILSEVEKYEKS